MGFKIKYNIIKNYLPLDTKRRPGTKLDKVLFLVAHDTGNKNSSANQNVTYFKNTANDTFASAHIFVDDKEIIECIPSFNNVEIAWHVWKSKLGDNRIYNADANYSAIGVEYCYGDNIDANEAYKKYVWVLAYLCYYHNLNPITDIIGHMVLDPERKTDPQNGLNDSGRNYRQLIIDVVNEYNDCINGDLIKLESSEVIKSYKFNNRYYVKLSDIEHIIKPLEFISFNNNVLKNKESEVDTLLLKYGMRGNKVEQLQRNLKKLGYNVGDIDGIYGSKTYNAVYKLQKDYDLLVDGVAGEQVLNKIKELLNNESKQVIQSKAKYYQIASTHILEVNPMDLHAEIIKERGDKIKGDFVNGTFFNYTNYTSTGNIVVNGKLLGKQQIYKNGKTWDYVKRGNFIVYKDGTVAVKMIMDIEKEEDISKIHFAISGFNMFPLDLKAEWFNPKEVGYQTWRTVLGYKKSDNKVIIAVRPSSTAERGQQTLINLGCDIGIGLDSGGSTNARFNGKTIRTTSRVLQNIIRWEV